MGFVIEQHYDDTQMMELLKSLIEKYREDASPYLEGENLEMILGDYVDALYHTKTNYLRMQKEFLDFLNESGTASLYSISDFWNKDHQIMMYKFRPEYLKEVLDVLDSPEWKKITSSN